MNKDIALILLIFSPLAATAQTAITAVSTNSTAATSSFSYSSGINTYNWGLAPNNSTVSVNGFTAGGLGYTYASHLAGTVKLRRVNNAGTTGNFSLVWAEVVNAGNTFNMFPAYQNDMEAFFNNRTYNKGTDNFFDNTSSNSNNIERLDWILPGGYSTPSPAKIGFAVFERGATGAHDPFCIAAITSLDGSGNPASYSNIVRVTASNYADPGPNVTYRILKASYPGDLLDAGTNTQNRGGVIISLANLGLAPNTIMYGYSLFANDLPVGATPANLVDYNNPTYFPTNTGNPGGIDLVAVTGIYIENSILPTRFVSFGAVENDNRINLKWMVENQLSVAYYEIERSFDGINFAKINTVSRSGNSSTSTYSYTDFLTGITSPMIYYRIRQYDLDGSYYFSKIINLKKNNKEQMLAVYPNPVGNNMVIHLHATTPNDAIASVTNSSGAQVIFQQVRLATGNNSFSVNGIEKLLKGVYQLTIIPASGEKMTRQFIKQ